MPESFTRDTGSNDTWDPYKHDVYLYGYGYKVRSFSMDDAPALTPQFNTGEQGENDLDMLKTDGNTGFIGGMFQVDLDDREMVQTIINGYVNPDNKRIYNTQAHEIVASLNDQFGEVTATEIYKENLYIAVRNGTTNSMMQITPDEQVSELTLPAALINTNAITDLYWPRGADIESMLIATGNSGVDIYKYDGTNFAEWGVTGTYQTGTVFSALRGNLFMWRDGSVIFQYDTDNNRFNRIVSMGPHDEVLNAPNKMQEFNHRIWGGKPTGLYSFDGVTSARFIESQSQVADNCKHMADLHGWLYFNMDGYVWRHNSITVERLRDFRDTEIVDITSGQDRVWIVTQGGQGNSVIDQEGWSNDDTNIWCYDGVGWYLYNNKIIGNNQVSGMAMLNGKLWVHHSGVEASTPGLFTMINVADEWQNAGFNKEVMTIIGSEIDNGFPNVPKYLESIEIDYEDINVGDQIQVSVRTRDDTGSWSTWVDNSQPISTDSQATKRFFITNYKLMQYRVIVQKDITSTLSLESAYIHYSTMPNRRKRWNATLVCQGDDAFNPEMLSDRTHEKHTPKELRNRIYEAHRRNIPVTFLTPDFCILNQDLDDSQTGWIEVAGTTDTMRDIGTIYVDGELMHYDQREKNRLFIIKRSAWGTASTTHTTGAIVSEFHRVFVEHIIGEQFMVNEAERNLDSEDNSKGLQSLVNLQITEVNTEHAD